MDAADIIIEYIPFLIGGGMVVALAGVWGYVHNTKMKIHCTILIC